MGSKIQKSNILTWNKINKLLSQYIVPIANQAPSVFYRYGNAADFIFSSLYPCWTWGNTILVIKPILGAAGWELHGSPPTHTRGRQIRSYHLLLVCPSDTPNIWCKFSHTSPDLLIRSGQVKKCFSSGERASGRKKIVVNSVYWKERHSAYCFSTLSCESYLRAALFGLNHSNRIVFFERVPRNLFVSDLNLKRYSFKKYTVLIAF